MAVPTKKNGVDINWGTLTGSFSLQTVVGVALYDASTAGVLKEAATFGTARPILPGDSFKIVTGALSFTLIGASGGVDGDAQGLAILDALMGSTVIGPATLYAALMTVMPAGTGGGTEFAGGGGSYARVALTNNSTNFPAAALL